MCEVLKTIDRKWFPLEIKFLYMWTNHSVDDITID